MNLGFQTLRIAGSTTLVLLLLSLYGRAQEISVSRLAATMGNGVGVELWVSNPVVRFGTGLRIHVRVSNPRGNRSIFLVRKSAPEFDTRNNRILIEAPIPLPINHGDYDYYFEKIQPGSRLATFIDVPARQFRELGQTRVFVGLGFVNDIGGINRKLRPGEDPITLRGPLANRMQTLGLGNLQLNVVESNREK